LTTAHNLATIRSAIISAIRDASCLRIPEADKTRPPDRTSTSSAATTWRAST
jgi:hypothetical protein